MKCDKPTKEEMTCAIKTTKNGIPVEAPKVDIETMIGMLLSPFEKLWNKEEILTDWKEGHIIKLPKETSATVKTTETLHSYQYCGIF